MKITSNMDSCKLAIEQVGEIASIRPETSSLIKITPLENKRLLIEASGQQSYIYTMLECDIITNGVNQSIYRHPKGLKKLYPDTAKEDPLYHEINNDSIKIVYGRIIPKRIAETPVRINVKGKKKYLSEEQTIKLYHFCNLIEKLKKYSEEQYVIFESDPSLDKYFKLTYMITSSLYVDHTVYLQENIPLKVKKVKYMMDVDFLKIWAKLFGRNKCSIGFNHNRNCLMIDSGEMHYFQYICKKSPTYKTFLPNNYVRDKKECQFKISIQNLINGLNDIYKFEKPDNDEIIINVDPDKTYLSSATMADTKKSIKYGTRRDAIIREISIPGKLHIDLNSLQIILKTAMTMSIKNIVITVNGSLIEFKSEDQMLRIYSGKIERTKKDEK